uniref:Myb-like, SWIRM and MPN domain-containing protein 1 n=1 Tax=Electrophorus electricus TaxID=8005 RepID=A0A4W4FIJ4_ELEEL
SMADELDVVDIEGDECGTDEGHTGARIFQHDYLHSAWKTTTAVLPWTLDSSISEENREVIETMLLEEQYYFTGKKVPKVTWTNDRHKIKKSPVKSSGSSARWSQGEKDLFEKGLIQFGRRWTKISKLIGTRTVLQVKSYARQYFKNKVGHCCVDLLCPPTQRSLLHAPPSGSSPPSASPRLPTLTNAIRIEQLSDDEDVDITDDLSDEASQPDSHSDLGDEPKGSDHRHDQVEPAAVALSTGRLNDHISSPEETEERPAGLSPEGTEVEEEHEEEEELKAPEQEVTLDTSTITEEEKQAIPEFFEGRPSKTPERYLKIRNYILDQWEKSKPKYLNKTSVRPGLKNCGDVNCIGRIHTYLELIGAINFNCDQAIYNRPRPVDRSRAKESRDSLETYQLAQRLQSMRARKRRVRDAWGNWCDAKDLEGQTYEVVELKSFFSLFIFLLLCSFDPFQLVPCKTFGEDRQEPFRVIVCAEALLVMEVHAHVSMGEVIGLLGGSYDDEEKVLKVYAAEPCNSLSTGLQCEMDPVSQTQASELLGVKGHNVVGWYHSHPAFEPNPSLRDIDTQAKYQSYFSRGGAPFVGMIVSPYNPSNPSPTSQTTCLLVQEETETTGTHKLPYKFEYEVSTEPPDWTEVMRRAEWVVFKYRQSHGSVHFRFHTKPAGPLIKCDLLNHCFSGVLGFLPNTLWCLRL